MSSVHQISSIVLRSASQTTTKTRSNWHACLFLCLYWIATRTLALPSECSNYVSNTAGTRSINSYGSPSPTCDSGSTFGSSSIFWCSRNTHDELGTIDLQLQFRCHWMVNRKLSINGWNNIRNTLLQLEWKHILLLKCDRSDELQRLLSWSINDTDGVELEIFYNVNAELSTSLTQSRELFFDFNFPSLESLSFLIIESSANEKSIPDQHWSLKGVSDTSKTRFRHQRGIFVRVPIYKSVAVKRREKSPLYSSCFEAMVGSFTLPTNIHLALHLNHRFISSTFAEIVEDRTKERKTWHARIIRITIYIHSASIGRLDVGGHK